MIISGCRQSWNFGNLSATTSRQTTPKAIMKFSTTKQLKRTCTKSGQHRNSKCRSKREYRNTILGCHKTKVFQHIPRRAKRNKQTIWLANRKSDFFPCLAFILMRRHVPLGEEREKPTNDDFSDYASLRCLSSNREWDYSAVIKHFPVWFLLSPPSETDRV